MATSFKKKTTTRSKPSLPQGTKASLNNNQLLISSGCPSLDTLLGGGLTVGSLVLLEEDVHGSNADILRKYFIAEGVACQQSVYLASVDTYTDKFLKTVPIAVNDGKSKAFEANNSKDDDSLQIAWRYQNKPKVQQSLPIAQFGHYYDLTYTLTEDDITNLNYTSFSEGCLKPNSEVTTANIFKDLLLSIKEKIYREELLTKNSTHIPSVLRILLSSLGSPLWSQSLINSENYDSSLSWFLSALRSLLRQSYATALITIPTYLFEEKYVIKRIEHCCDVVVHLDSFAGSEKSQNPLFKEYHGMLHVKKVPLINSMCGVSIDTSDLAFKVKRKKFVIEKLHLPPELSDTVSRSQSSKTLLKQEIPLCSQTVQGKNLLDF